MHRFVCTLVLLSASITLAQAPSQPAELSARDIFWSASDLVVVAPNPATTGASPAKPPDAKPSRAETPPKTPKMRRQIDPKQVSLKGYGVPPRLVRASSTGSDRLGIRYTVLRREASGKYSEVLPGSTFYSGDRIKISLMTNHDGYLYLIQRGSSGNWSSIFPIQSAPQGSNYVESGKSYQVPFDTAFEFNQLPGEEQLYIVLSRDPIKDLDGAIFGLQRHNITPSSSTPSAAQDSTPVVASNHIPDTLVQQLVSRDLVPVQEEVNTPATDAIQQSEKAVYVVNAISDESEGKTLVAKVLLHHQ